VVQDEITSLVKYCDVETGLKILNGQSLRSSAPSLYQDPFEPHHETTLDFNKDILLKGVIKDAIGMLFGPSEPGGKANKLIAAICRWRAEDRFASEDEAEVVLKQLLGQITEQHYVSIDTYIADWEAFAKNIRICSFSNKVDNMSCWEAYAANHSGLALKFSSGEETSLPEPRRMNYSSTPPVVTNLKEQVDVIFGRQVAPSKEEFLLKLLTKDKNNSMEKEWRCFNVENSDDGLLYNTKDFSASELKAVYFGLAMSDEDKSSIQKIITEKFKKTKMYQAIKLPNKYEVDFERIGDV
jgi:hypothetical protein